MGNIIPAQAKVLWVKILRKLSSDVQTGVWARDQKGQHQRRALGFLGVNLGPEYIINDSKPSNV